MIMSKRFFAVYALLGVGLALISLRPFFSGLALVGEAINTPAYHHSLYAPERLSLLDRRPSPEREQVAGLAEAIAEAQVIPFTAALGGVWAAFLLLPLVWKRPARKALAAGIALGSAVFVAGEALVEALLLPFPQVAERLLMTRMMMPLELEYLDIPWRLRLHYYLFALVLVALLVSFLYAAARLLGKKDDAPRPLSVALLGVVAGAYAFFCAAGVRIMYHSLVLGGTRVSSVSAVSMVEIAGCISLAAVAVGLVVCLLIKKTRRRAVLAGIAASLTAGGMYAAQGVLLKGRLYTPLLAEDSPLLWPLFRPLLSGAGDISAFTLLIIVFSGAAAFGLAKMCGPKGGEQTR